MSTLERAIAIAAEAHAGQVDKGGQPYILHPLRVMMAVPPEAKITAVLHDVVEDCPEWTFDRLEAEGFHPVALSALDTVTRRAGETYDDFIDRAAMNAIGRTVKIADLRDNINMSRLAYPTSADWARWRRYDKALRRLLADDPCLQDMCKTCNGSQWVCESHPDKPWGDALNAGPNACHCGGAGKPCPECNPLSKEKRG